MRDLANYSIETDHTVLLTYVDGIRRRVPIAELDQHLKPADKAVVETANHLRKNFLKSHMPKVALTLAAGGALAAFSIVGKPVATQMLQHEDSAAPTDSSAVVRSVSPGADTSAEPVPSASATPVTHVPAVAKVDKPARAVDGISKASVPAAPSPVPTAPATEPTVTPAPSPTATPTPAATPQPGQVLGDHTENPLVASPSPSPATE